MSPETFLLSDADEARAPAPRVALPTPAEIAESVVEAAGCLLVARKSARAHQDAVCAALLAEINRAESRWGSEAHEFVYAFVARLRGAPPQLVELVLSLRRNSSPLDVSWLRSLPSTDSRILWDVCPDGSWLLRVAATLGISTQYLVLASCACAELALVYVDATEWRPRVAIDKARRWARGEVTLDELRRSEWDAGCALTDARHDVQHCGDATLKAALEATLAAFVAVQVDTIGADLKRYDMGHDAAEGARAAAAFSSAAASEAMRARCADAVREAIPWPVLEEALRRAPGGAS